MINTESVCGIHLFIYSASLVPHEQCNKALTQAVGGEGAHSTCLQKFTCRLLRRTLTTSHVTRPKATGTLLKYRCYEIHRDSILIEGV